MDLDGLHIENSAETEQVGQQSRQTSLYQARFPILPTLHPPLQGPSLATDCSSMEELKVPTDQQDS